MQDLRAVADRFNGRASTFESAVASGDARGKQAAIASACGDCWRAAADEVLLLIAKMEMAG